MSLFVLQQQAPTQQQFAIPAEGLRIGRTPENAVQLADDVVSRHHATVWEQASQVYIRDEGTTNGTFVGGKKIVANTPQPVQVGDEIRIGTAVFVVNPAPVVAAAPVVAVAAAAAPPVKTNPVYLIAGAAIFGLVVVIVLAAALSGPGPAMLVPPPITTAAPVVTPVTSPTITASATPTPPATSAATVPANPPAARPIVSPTSNPINLIEPANGAGFSGPYILLKWSTNRPLNAGERYKVTIDCDRANGLAPEVSYTTNPQLEVPPGIYKSVTGERKCRWRVQVVASDGSPVSPASAINVFVWEKEPGNPAGSTTGPQATPTMGR